MIDFISLLHVGASLGVATEQPIDTSTAAGKAFLDMLGVFAEFETNLRRERQLEGIAKAKAAGVYKGRKPSINPSEVKRLKADGLGASEIAKRMTIGRHVRYRGKADITMTCFVRFGPIADKRGCNWIVR